MHIAFLSEAIAKRIVPAPNIAMISISDFDLYDDSPRVVELMPGWENLLRLYFSDIDKPQSNYVLFNEEHAKSIIDFIKKISHTGIDCEKVDIIIVHCAAGISRSAAVAKFVAYFFEDETFNHEYSMYNRHVYSVLNSTMNKINH